MENVGKNCNLKTMSREYDILANIGNKEAFMFYWETRLNVKGQHAPIRNNQRLKYMAHALCHLQLHFSTNGNVSSHKATKLKLNRLSTQINQSITAKIRL